MKLKANTIESLLLVVIFILTWFTVVWITGSPRLLHPSYDLNIHDTTFVLTWQTLIMRPYLMMITMLYLIREWRQGFKRRFQNLVMVISNALFIVQLYPLFVVAGMLAGWSPELSLSVVSASSLESTASYQSVYWLVHFKMLLVLVLIIFMAILLVTTLLTGKNWNAENRTASFSPEEY